MPIKHAADADKAGNKKYPPAKLLSRSKPEQQTANPANAVQGTLPASHPVAHDRVLQLQGTIGNRAVRRLLAKGSKHPVQANLTVGSANDPYEQEADQVAQQGVAQDSPLISPRAEGDTASPRVPGRPAGQVRLMAAPGATVQRLIDPDLQPVVVKYFQAIANELHLDPTDSWVAKVLVKAIRDFDNAVLAGRYLETELKAIAGGERGALASGLRAEDITRIKQSGRIEDAEAVLNERMSDPSEDTRLKNEIAITFEGGRFARITGSGEGGHVDISEAVPAMSTHAVITHNHPNGNPLSDGDMIQARKRNAAQIRATGRYGTWVMTRPGGGWPEEGDLLQAYGDGKQWNDIGYPAPSKAAQLAADTPAKQLRAKSVLDKESLVAEVSDPHYRYMRQLVSCERVSRRLGIVFQGPETAVQALDRIVEHIITTPALFEEAKKWLKKKASEVGASTAKKTPEGAGGKKVYTLW